VPYSDRQTEKILKSYVLEVIPKTARILDVGPGAGANYEMLKEDYPNLDCVEIFEPYVDRFRLREKYKTVFIQNIMDFDNIQDYDLIIMGDVLEHLTVEDSKKLLQKIHESEKTKLLIQVPYQYQQGITEENIHEIHIQDDLTEAIMADRYGDFLEILHIQSYLGIYIKKLSKNNIDGLPSLQEIGLKYNTDKAFHHKYMDFYESNLQHLRQQNISLLEIGYFKGDSIRAWLEYFPNANVHCIDIIDVDFKHERFKYYKISQEDQELTQLFEDNFFDIIIDDGSHMTSHQNKSLELLWTKLKNSGFYLLEDLHTSFIGHYINSPVTPYNFLKNGASIEEIDHVIDEAAYIKIFHRVPGLNTDSITSVIKKK
jgi:hypothetical protein